MNQIETKPAAAAAAAFVLTLFGWQPPIVSAGTAMRITPIMKAMVLFWMLALIDNDNDFDDENPWCSRIPSPQDIE
jgi:hypothetical protein